MLAEKQEHQNRPSEPQRTPQRVREATPTTAARGDRNRRPSVRHVAVLGYN